MPVEINAATDIQLMLNVTTMNIIMSYFELIPTLVGTWLTLVPIHVRRVAFYHDPIGDMTASFFMSSFWQCASIVVIHLV